MSEKLIPHSLAPAVLDQPVKFWRVFWTGLGKMVGVGVFVVIGILAGSDRSQVGLALVLAALLSLWNGLNRIPLVVASRADPQSMVGQEVHSPKNDSPNSDLPTLELPPLAPQPLEIQAIYAYSDHHLNSWLGFAAALALTFAQATAAATAALGLAGYLIHGTGWNNPIALLPMALVVLAVTTGIVWQGVRVSRRLQGVRLGITIGALICLMAAVAYKLYIVPISPTAALVISVEPTGLHRISAVLHTTSLFMVTYAGCGTIAASRPDDRTPYTHRPPPLRLFMRRLLSQSLVGLIGCALLLYSGVALTARNLISIASLQQAVDLFASPLLEVANLLQMPVIPQIVTGGAVVTLAAILYALVSDLATSLRGMGQRRDLPTALAKLSSARRVPHLAIAVAGGTIAVLLMVVGEVMALWSFSTFAFLVHAAITNLAATQLRFSRYSRWLAALAGLLCLVLILGLGWRVWMVGTGWLVIGLMWRGINLWVLEQAEKQD